MVSEPPETGNLPDDQRGRMIAFWFTHHAQSLPYGAGEGKGIFSESRTIGGLPGPPGRQGLKLPFFLMRERS